MKLTINDRSVQAREGETLLDVCRREGISVPTLCYAQDAAHQASCMVCMVRDAASGQMIPSCSTRAAEGMVIDTDSEEVRALRKMALELLLSDHRADCEAPCSVACPQKLNVEGVLDAWDRQDYAAGRRLLAAVFALPAVGCDDCTAPCEKVCRRGTVDAHVDIRGIIRELAAMEEIAVSGRPEDVERPDRSAFTSRIGAFSEAEKIRLRTEVDTPSTCLHCACTARHDCRLRTLATEAGIKSSRFGLDSRLPFKLRRHIHGALWFEPAKCIRCGLCVLNSEDAFTFKKRGFEMEVDIPEESRSHASESLAALCPTGALYLQKG